ncbi:C-type lectin [Pseudocercospora fijiensis CIRAD86]|uniref:C-type lectin n=1 Tax=Pseudocercospora fijiensis (strain CIRAD86) TaxID=383855 RepID=M3A7Z4_PSEFD|nr:C-type lectin [Pseudocercospora fijiensis CIRAD86]EME80726.1 C-type lectin [Pseudocercospora fijiensis CIRAD86]
MVLHLLGKKSWNVYNSDNVERVRRDEAEAKAWEEAAEQRMQEEDAQRRIALLRGEKVAPLVEDVEPPKQDDWRRFKHDDTYDRRDRKRRRLRGEDDTDRDIRYARQDTDTGSRATQELLKRKDKEAPLQDHAGNIQLFPAPDEKAIRATQKNEEVEAEKAKKRRREEDQVTMRFSNAAGYQNGMQKPWYAESDRKVSTTSSDPIESRNELMLAELKGKDVWGNEDPRRKEREQSRISSNDPFAAMQYAQRQLKQSERDKEAWHRRQQAEMEQLKLEQKREKDERRRRRNDDDEDSLNGFSLDAPVEEERGRDRHHRHRHSRHRSRSREREHRHRHGSRSRSRDRERHSSRRHHRHHGDRKRD